MIKTKYFIITWPTLCWDSETDPFPSSSSSIWSCLGLYLVPLFETLKDTPIVLFSQDFHLGITSSTPGVLQRIKKNKKTKKQESESRIVLRFSESVTLCLNAHENCSSVRFVFSRVSPWLLYMVANFSHEGYPRRGPSVCLNFLTICLLFYNPYLSLFYFIFSFLYVWIFIIYWKLFWDPVIQWKGTATLAFWLFVFLCFFW